MFAIIPAINGVPLVGSKRLYESIGLPSGQAVVYVEGDDIIQGSTPLNNKKYLSYFNAGTVKSDKDSIIADGIDIATITVEVVKEISSVDFYYIKDDKVMFIKNVVIDQDTKTGTLQILFTDIGRAKIRAGNETVTKLNEVVIHAI